MNATTKKRRPKASLGQNWSVEVSSQFQVGYSRARMMVPHTRTASSSRQQRASRTWVQRISAQSGRFLFLHLRISKLANLRTAAQQVKPPLTTRNNGT